MNLLKEVTDMMHELGTPTHMKGHDYLRSAIVHGHDDKELLNHMMKGLYTTVAKAHDTTAARVERDIRAVIEVTWLRGNPRKLYKIFRNTVCSKRGKPTNKEFITMFIDHFKIK